MERALYRSSQLGKRTRDEEEPAEKTELVDFFRDDYDYFVEEYETLLEEHSDSGGYDSYMELFGNRMNLAAILYNAETTEDRNYLLKHLFPQEMHYLEHEDAYIRFKRHYEGLFKLKEEAWDSKILTFRDFADNHNLQYALVTHFDDERKPAGAIFVGQLCNEKQEPLNVCMMIGIHRLPFSHAKVTSHLISKAVEWCTDREFKRIVVAPYPIMRDALMASGFKETQTTNELFFGYSSLVDIAGFEPGPIHYGFELSRGERTKIYERTLGA